MSQKASGWAIAVNNGGIMLLFATFLWGGNAVAGKLANGEVSPMLLTFFRWFLASIIVVIIARKHLVEDWKTIRENIWYFILLAPIGFTLFNLMLYSALTYTTALNVTIEQAAMPMFIFLINFIVFRAKPLAIQLVGYTVTLIGVLLTVSGGDYNRLLNLEFNQGDVIMIFAAFSYAGYSVGLRAKPKMHWMSFLSVLIFIAGIVSVPFALYEWTTPKFIWPHSTLGWGVVAYAAIGPSIIAQACFIRGNELLGANNAALFLNSVPIFGALLSVLILGEAFKWYHALAMVLVLGGIFMAQHFAKKLKA